VRAARLRLRPGERQQFDASLDRRRRRGHVPDGCLWRGGQLDQRAATHLVQLHRRGRQHHRLATAPRLGEQQLEAERLSLE